MSDILTERDPITTHDWKPARRKRPDWLITAQIMADEAWAEYDKIIMQELYSDWEYLEPDYDRIKEASKKAEQLDNDYCQAYNCWMGILEAKNDR